MIAADFALHAAAEPPRRLRAKRAAADFFRVDGGEPVELGCIFLGLGFPGERGKPAAGGPLSTTRTPGRHCGHGGGKGERGQGRPSVHAEVRGARGGPPERPNQPRSVCGRSRSPTAARGPTAVGRRPSLYGSAGTPADRPRRPMHAAPAAGIATLTQPGCSRGDDCRDGTALLACWREMPVHERREPRMLSRGVCRCQ